jgi:hypothetical protein
MKKIIATIAATGLLLVGGASAASAETMYRNGANKVTITATGAPEGAQITKAKVTVKKGKKTVARNKNFYKAKKGTYKVTSTVTYYMPGTSTWVEGATTSTTKTVAANDLYLGTCTVTSRAIAQDNSTYKYWYGQIDYLSGEVWVDYTANCPAYFYDSNFNSKMTNVSVKWRESVYVLVESGLTGVKSTDLWKDIDMKYIGQYTDDASSWTLVNPVTYTETTTAPGYWTYTPDGPSLTTKNTRTVSVR